VDDPYFCQHALSSSVSDNSLTSVGLDSSSHAGLAKWTYNAVWPVLWSKLSIGGMRIMGVRRRFDIAIRALRTPNWNNTNRILTLRRGNGAELTLFITVKNIGTNLAGAVVRLNVQSVPAGVLHIILPAFQTVLLFPGQQTTMRFRVGFIALQNASPGINSVLVVSTSSNPNGSDDDNPNNSIKAVARLIRIT
jgi:hypothetical protein